MANNLNSSKMKNMLKSKGFVTAACAVLAVVVLVVGYNIRIKEATKPVRVPVANKKLTARHRITQDDIGYVEMPQGALGGDYYANDSYIINQYVNIDTTIPEGSLFYNGSIVSESQLPDSALSAVKEGETLYYLTVNMLTSYNNAILPNRYIDIYVSTKENGKALVGKLLKNVKVLQVKTADGRDVFEDSEESRTPYVIIFSLPEEQHLLLRKVDAINNYSIAASDSGFSTIELIPIPRKEFGNGDEEELEPEIASEYLEEFILNLAAVIPEDIEFIPTNNPNE